jgi:pimeloyl-ACP methyl ester carboxylesterase
MSKRLGASGKAVLAGVLGFGSAVGFIAYRRLGASRALPPAIHAARETVDLMSSGAMTVYVDRQGPGRPLVLLHGIHAAGSAMDVKPFFTAFRGRRPVFAPDLPGFGASDRHDHVYSPALYTFAIMQLLEEIATKDAPPDVIALGLSSELAARAARDRPDLFNSLTLVSPTGFSESAPGLEKSDLRRLLLELPIAREGLFGLLAMRASIHHFLARSFAGPIDPGLARYANLTARQPGAQHALAYFLRGELFTPRVAEMIYAKVHVPTLVLHDGDPHTDFAKLERFIALHPAWRHRRIAPTRGLPHFEKPEETFAALEAFWREIAIAPAALERAAESGMPPAEHGLR